MQTPTNLLHRRSFLKQSSLAGAGLLILPSGLRAAGQSPNDKLNIALIGAWGRAAASWVAMERFKIGVIPTLAACAVLGMVVNILGWA